MYKNISYYEQKKYANLTDKAYDIIEEMIVTTELKPGQVYSEAELSGLVNIGRTPVREAIKRLEPTHVVNIIPRNGIKIAPVRLEECFLQMEVRIMLEKLVSVRAAKFSTPTERQIFLDLATRYRRSTESEDALNSIRIDYEFNTFMADCSRNIFAKTALLPLHPLARRLYFMQYNIDRQLTHRINQSHIAVMKSIAEGKEQETLDEMEDLIKNIKMLTVATMDSMITGGDFSKRITEK